MSDPIDPYHKWLAIPPEDQPPTHYRLLAIERFETDKEVIINAAEQRLSHLRTLEMGEDGQLAKELAVEIEAARDCLLDPQERDRYAATLKEKEDRDTAKTVPQAPAGVPAARRKKKTASSEKREKKINLIGHILAPIIGLALGGIVLLVLRGGDEEPEDSGPADFTIGSQLPEEFPVEEPVEEPVASSAESPLEPAPPRQTAQEGAVEEPEQGNPAAGETGEVAGDELPESATSTIPLPGDAQTAAGEESLASEVTEVTEETEASGATEAAEVPAAKTREEILAEMEAELERAVSERDLKRQFHIAAAMARLDAEDGFDHQRQLLKEYRSAPGATIDYRMATGAALFLAKQAGAAGQMLQARQLAADALRDARQTGDQNLVRQVTRQILELPAGESE